MTNKQVGSVYSTQNAVVSCRTTWVWRWLAWLMAVISGFALGSSASATGTWTSLVNPSPIGGVHDMLLLTDGSVMAHVSTGSWVRLTPDATGSYVNGTWTTLAPMNAPRLYFSSQVLKDGRVFVAGGEYYGGTYAAEVYDPKLNTWTVTPTEGEEFADMVSNTLPDGDVLISGWYESNTQGSAIYHIATNTWTTGLLSLESMGECTWLKLPDGSILNVDPSPDTGGGPSERFIPAQNQWVADATIPISLVVGGETGPAFLLPNGHAMFMGYYQPGIYTPSGTSSPGTWVAGPAIPNGLNCGDTGGAMMVNGVILFEAQTSYSSGAVTFFEYDYTTNAYTVAPTPPNAYGGAAFNNNMMCLPDGNIICTTSTNTLAVYTPGSAALAIGKPTISSIVRNTDGSYTVAGTLLNGITEGGSYGDDVQTASNYPIVRMTSSGGTVYYARTFNWGSTEVNSGAATSHPTETTQFTLPPGLPAGTYSVVVSANGNASSATSLTIPATGDTAPTVATAAAASPSTVTGTTTNLSVLGASGNGESSLTYTWTAVGPAGVPLPSYSINASNAAKNTTATFHQAGSYAFTVSITDAYGLFVRSSAVSVTVNQVLATITVSPGAVNLTAGQTAQFSATGYDQFGLAMSSQPSFSWALTSGGGSLSAGGLYTSPSSGTEASITATSGTIQGAAGIYVVSAPWVSTDVGSVGIAGSAHDSNGVFTISGEGSDIWGTADQFHYVYRSLGGDGMIVAHVASQEDTAGWAYAGVMIRESTAAGAAHMMMAVTPSAGTVQLWRSATGGSSAYGNTAGLAAPYWVKLVRSGNNFSAYRSPDGVTWTQQGSTVSIPMAASVDIGLVVDSYNTSELCTATFDHVSFLTTSGESLQVVGDGSATTDNLLAKATGPAGATLTITGVTQGASGTVVNNGNGTYTYTANPGAEGTDSFIYTVSDGLGDTATATVTVYLLSSPWMTADIGVGTFFGFSFNSGGVFTANGEGDIYGSADAFHYVYRSLNGDGTIITRAVTQQDTGGWAYAGVMIRETTSAGAAHAMIAVTPSNGVTLIWRSTTGGSSNYTNTAGLVVPYWVKLVRSGNSFTAYQSADGNTWAQEGSVLSIPMASSVDVGLVVSSFSSGSCTATFDNVSLITPAPTVATAAAASPSPVNGGQTNLSVLGASGAGESTLTYTWAATALPGGASAPAFSVNGTNAAKNTVATFAAAGAYTFVVTITDANNATVTSSVNVTVNQTLTSVAVAPVSVALGSDGSQQFTATGNDQFGQALTAQPGFTWTNTGSGSVNSTGLYTGSYASGTATVTATSGGVSGSASVTVTNAAPTVATAASASPSTVTGATTSLSVLGADSDGGGQPNLTYAWSATSVPSGASAPTYSANGTNAAKATTATFTSAGSYTLKATITDLGGLSVTSSVNVTVNQTLTAIAVSPNSAAVSSDGTQQFTATGSDQFGHALTSQPTFTWSNSGSGSVNSSGLYTASYAAGSATVTAASGGLSAFSIVTVTNAAPTVATAAAASPSTVTGTTTALTVLGADSDGGGASNLTYTWAATTLPTGADAPVFSANGTNAAKSTTATFNHAGAYTFQVAITDAGGLSVTSSVNVTVNQTVTSALVGPGTATVSGSQTQQLTATGNDQFGQVMGTQPGFTWAVTAGAGTVSSAGLYTAPATATTATVTATTGSIHATATINVVPGLAHEWKFDDGSGTVAADAMGTSNATVTGGTWTNGAFNGGLSLSGVSTSYASVPAMNLNSNTMTITGWLYLNGSQNTYTGIVYSRASSNISGFNFGGTANTLGYTWNALPSTYNWNSGLTAPVSKWTFVALVITPTNATIYMQPQGGSMQSATNSVANSASSFNGVTLLGGDSYSSSRYFKGIMDDVRIYNTSLSAAQVADLGEQAPTVATAAAAAPNPVTGTTANLTVLGAYFAGESNLTYTWSAPTVPSGASAPVFSVNGTNAAKASTATFSQSGAYTLTATITDRVGLSVTSSVNVMVGGSVPAGWTSADIGAVGTAGWSSASGGVYTVNGAGADIYGTADAFQFASQTLVGDGEIRARVTAQTNTNAVAKAGVMIRDGSSAGAVNAVVEVTPGSGFIFQERTTVGGSTTYVAGPALNAAPNNWVRLTRSGTLITAYVSADGANWTSIGTTNLTMNSSVSVGLAVSSHTTAQASTVIFDNVSVTPLPSPWQSLDLGTIGLQGSAEYFNSAYTLKGAGNVSGTADNFHYLCQMLSGDGQLIAQVNTLQNTGASAVVGVMIRDGLSTGSMYACMGMTGTGGYAWQTRSSTGGTTSITAGGTGVPPNAWVKVVRSGTTLSGYSSPDGVTWTPVGTQSITMGANIYIGFVDASGSTTTLNTSAFDNVSIVP